MQREEIQLLFLQDKPKSKKQLYAMWKVFRRDYLDIFNNNFAPSKLPQFKTSQSMYEYSPDIIDDLQAGVLTGLITEIVKTHPSFEYPYKLYTLSEKGKKVIMQEIYPFLSEFEKVAIDQLLERK